MDNKKNLNTRVRIELTKIEWLFLALLLIWLPLLLSNFIREGYNCNSIIEVKNKNNKITQQACIEVEDCAKGWGCQRRYNTQLVGKCVFIKPRKKND